MVFNFDKCKRLQLEDGNPDLTYKVKIIDPGRTR